MQQSKLPIEGVTPKEVLMEPWESIPFDYAAFKERAERITDVFERRAFIIKTYYEFIETREKRALKRYEHGNSITGLKLPRRIIKGIENRVVAKPYDPEFYFTPQEIRDGRLLLNEMNYSKDLVELNLKREVTQVKTSEAEIRLHDLKQKYETQKIILNCNDSQLDEIINLLNGQIFREKRMGVVREYFINFNYSPDNNRVGKKLRLIRTNSALNYFVKELIKIDGLVINTKQWVAITGIFESKKGKALKTTDLGKSLGGYQPRDKAQLDELIAKIRGIIENAKE